MSQPCHRGLGGPLGPFAYRLPCPASYFILQKLNTYFGHKFNVVRVWLECQNTHRIKLFLLQSYIFKGRNSNTAAVLH